MEALGVPRTVLDAVDLDYEAMWYRIRHDDSFVKDFHLESLRETLSLDYPSYILALAMGAGKTILIGL
jgi:type III restriction enzyme